MDALRNTLREWSLTASPCSNAAGGGPDHWTPARLHDDDDPHTNEGTPSFTFAASEQPHGAAGWHPHRRHHHHHHHHHPYHSSNNNTNLNNGSFARSAAFSSSHRSAHKGGDSEEYDERRHLRAALHSAVVGSTRSSQLSSFLPTHSHPRFYGLLNEECYVGGEEQEEEEEEDRGLGSNDDDDDVSVVSESYAAVTLPDSEGAAAGELGMLTPHERLCNEELATPPTVLQAAAPHTPNFSVSYSAGAAAATTSCTGSSGNINNSNSKGDDDGVPSPMTPLKLSVTLLQSRRSNPAKSPHPLTKTVLKHGAAATPTPTGASSSFQRPPRPSPLVVKPQRSFASSGYLPDEEASPQLPPVRTQTNTPLLQPTSFLRLATEELAEATAAAAASVQDYGIASPKSGVTSPVLPPVRCLVPLMEVLSDTAREATTGQLAVERLPLSMAADVAQPHHRSSSAEESDDAGQPTCPGGPVAGEADKSAQQVTAVLEGSHSCSALHGLSISIDVAGLVTTKEAKTELATATVAADTANSSPPISLTSSLHGCTPLPPAAQATLPTPQTAPAAFGIHGSASTPSFTATPTAAPHPPSHQPPLSSSSPSSSSSPLAAQSTDDTPPVLPAVIDSRPPSTPPQPLATAAEASGRRPLLIPQPHSKVRDLSGRAVLLRAYRHAGALSTQPCPPTSSSQAALYGGVSASTQPHSRPSHSHNVESLSLLSDVNSRVSPSLTEFGLCAVPQPYGAYPYSWALHAEHSGTGQSGESCLGGGSGSGGAGSGGGGTPAAAATAAAMQRRPSSHPSSYGTLSSSTPAPAAGLQRSVSDGQLLTMSGRRPTQGCC